MKVENKMLGSIKREWKRKLSLFLVMSMLMGNTGLNNLAASGVYADEVATEAGAGTDVVTEDTKPVEEEVEDPVEDSTSVVTDVVEGVHTDEIDDATGKPQTDEKGSEQTEKSDDENLEDRTSDDSEDQDTVTIDRKNLNMTDVEAGEDADLIGDKKNSIPIGDTNVDGLMMNLLGENLEKGPVSVPENGIVYKGEVYVPYTKAKLDLNVTVNFNDGKKSVQSLRKDLTAENLFAIYAGKDKELSADDGVIWSVENEDEDKGTVKYRVEIPIYIVQGTDANGKFETALDFYKIQIRDDVKALESYELLSEKKKQIVFTEDDNDDKWYAEDLSFNFEIGAIRDAEFTMEWWDLLEEEREQNRKYRVAPTVTLYREENGVKERVGSTGSTDEKKLDVEIQGKEDGNVWTYVFKNLSSGDGVKYFIKESLALQASLWVRNA